MDLSTTNKIIRRIFQIYPLPNQLLTNCFINNVNFFDNRDLTNIMFRISSFYMNCSAIPTFLPKYLEGQFDANYVNNLQPTTTVNFHTPADNIFRCDYLVNIVDTSTGANTAIPVNFTPEYSVNPDQAPTYKTTSASSQYENPYWFVFDTTVLCDILSKAISDAIQTVTAGVVSNGCNVVKSGNGYVMYLATGFHDGTYILQFSKSLIDLFAFKNVASTNSSNLYSIIFNTQSRIYNGTSVYEVFSKYISDKWNAFDNLVFKTSCPIQKIKVYDNNSYEMKSYENVILEFKIGAIPYNFFTSKFTPDENWCSMINTNSRDNMFINCYLRNRETGSLFPYKIVDGEQFSITTEEIETD